MDGRLPKKTFNNLSSLPLEHKVVKWQQLVIFNPISRVLYVTIIIFQILKKKYQNQKKSCNIFTNYTYNSLLI